MKENGIKFVVLLKVVLFFLIASLGATFYQMVITKTWNEMERWGKHSVLFRLLHNTRIKVAHRTKDSDDKRFYCQLHGLGMHVEQLCI